MKRDLYWDSLKFILIFFVVCGHCIGSYLPTGGINRVLYNFIFTFHIPLFIFVSGMFSTINDRNKYKLGIIRLLETYIVFQLIKSFFSMLLSSGITVNSIVFSICVPRYTLWYLLSLIFWRLSVFFIPSDFLSKYPIKVIFTCFFISLLGGFIPIDKEFSIQRTLTFLPFFFMGYYARRIELKKYIAKVPSLVALTVLLSIFLIYFFILNKPIGFILKGKATYWSSVEFSPFLFCLARGAFLFTATIMGVMVMRLVPTKTSLSKWGRITLFIYIYHSFAIECLRLVIRYGYFPKNEWMLIVMSVIITMGLVLLSHIKFFKILLNPISYIMNSRNKSTT